MSIAEALLIAVAAYLGHVTRYAEFPEFVDYLLPAATFSLLLVISMSAMGVYESRIREGFAGMMLRTAVSIFLLGTIAVAVVSYMFPQVAMHRGVLLFSATEAFLLLGIWRWITGKFISEDALKQKVLVLGVGQRALPIARRMRRKSDRRAFILAGFVNAGGTEDHVSQFGGQILDLDTSIYQYCQDHNVEEIVIALDERRRTSGNNDGLPLDDLMDCRLSGIDVCDVQEFVEREACRVDVDLLQPSWMVFSDGFVSNVWRNLTKRAFDIVASLMLLLVTWPFMLIAGFAIWVEGKFREPIFYKQERVGLEGEPFNVIKFRSMRTDAEKEGQAVWATENDPRITKVGGILRSTRIDELPQLFNVFNGDMSFVGPRPERPTFVDDLNTKVPFYEQRHRIKPGITGWAQLCYPYGASVEDSKEKLQYDLYYLKNHSILLDMIILLQTVEVVLVGDGAR